MLESIYKSALCVELNESDISFGRQKLLPVLNKGQRIREFRIDVVVVNHIVLELKSVERFDPVIEAQILSSIKL